MDDFQTVLKEELTKRFTEQRNIGILIVFVSKYFSSNGSGKPFVSFPYKTKTSSIFE